MGEPKWYQILAALVDAMKPYARHGVNVNVDFYAGVVYYLNGIPKDLFVPIFAVGRVPGWTVQVMEQMENNILIRPLTALQRPRAARTTCRSSRAEWGLRESLRTTGWGLDRRGTQRTRRGYAEEKRL